MTGWLDTVLDELERVRSKFEEEQKQAAELLARAEENDRAARMRLHHATASIKALTDLRNEPITEDDQ